MASTLCESSLCETNHLGDGGTFGQVHKSITDTIRHFGLDLSPRDPWPFTYKTSPLPSGHQSQRRPQNNNYNLWLFPKYTQNLLLDGNIKEHSQRSFHIYSQCFFVVSSHSMFESPWFSLS